MQGDPVTLKDALGKIRELRAAHAASEARHEATADTLRDRLADSVDAHLAELRKVRAVAAEREAVLLEDINPEKVRASVVSTTAAAHQREITALEAELHTAHQAVKEAHSTVATLRAQLETSERTSAGDIHVRDAELELMRQSLLREEEQGAVLRTALSRERDLLCQEREGWRAGQAQAADALAEYRQRAAKAELNARWVANVQTSLQVKDTAARAATAATELLLELLEAVRLASGPIPVDATLNKTLRSSAGVTKAMQAGVDVGVLLSSGLSGFSGVRAAANAESTSCEREDAGSPHQNADDALIGAVSPGEQQQDLVERARGQHADVSSLLHTLAGLESPDATPTRAPLTATDPNVSSISASSKRSPRLVPYPSEPMALHSPDLSQAFYGL